MVAHLLVANEGEPSGYGAGQVDPEGSISIVRLPQWVRGRWNGTPTVRTVDFARYNGQEAPLRASGIRIYGPGRRRPRTSNRSTSPSRAIRAPR